jgi:malate dehydrogenase
MELDDCGFPTLQAVNFTDDPNVAFKDVNYALLVGSAPRKKGQERGDLLKVNGGIFVGQGQALVKNAASDVRIHIVGNPCNTNCLVAYFNGRDIPVDRWTAMTRLDHNRAIAQLAAKAGCHVSEVKRMTIWGNHSATQYPDIHHTTVKGKAASKLVDKGWLTDSFIPTVQQRGAAIIKARGASSAASAASAAIDHMRDWALGSPEGDWVSMGIPADGSYGIDEGVIYSYPVRCSKGTYEIVQDLQIDDFSRARMQATEKELREERAAIESLL